MSGAIEAVQAFLSGFGVAARAECDVTERGGGPYMTWLPAEPGLRSATDLGVRAWHRSAGLQALAALCRAVTGAVGAGLRLPCGDGAVVLWLGDPAWRLEAVPGDPGLKCARVALRAMALGGARDQTGGEQG